MLRVEQVHILEPWHNINLIEQSIGRVIRTGSHLHLPPQERNVSVYQYATTLKDRETYDLKIYKISEKWKPWRTVACCYMWSAVDPEPVEY